MLIYLPEVRAKNGGNVEYTFNCNLDDCFEDFSDGGILELKLKVAVSDAKVIVEGDLETTAPTDCPRCDITFEYNFKTSFTEMFSILEDIQMGQTAGTMAAETANMLTVRGDNLYLDEYIRQLIIMARGHNPLCQDDCKGLCAQCGTDLNQYNCSCSEDSSAIDVRMLKLKEFNN